jgi:hypothetical protein
MNCLFKCVGESDQAAGYKKYECRRCRRIVRIRANDAGYYTAEVRARVVCCLCDSRPEVVPAPRRYRRSVWWRVRVAVGLLGRRLAIWTRSRLGTR